jgi:peptidoglycan/LPS O-acetylase OafA/YrhL
VEPGEVRLDTLPDHVCLDEHWEGRADFLGSPCADALIMTSRAPAVTLARSRAERRSFYRPELDSLRFFAFFGVFICHVFPHDPAFYHLRVPAFPHALVSVICAIAGAGAFGVDLFFALSAYLITTLLMREEEIRGNMDVRAFYVRRILRIWPLYFFFVLLAAVVQIWDKNQRLSWHYIAGFMLLIGNWVYVWKGLTNSIANLLWSVSIEEQFYLAWPVALRRLSRRQLVLAVLCLLVVANVVRVWVVLSHGHGAAIEYNTFTRLDAIALGILVAYYLGTRVPHLSLYVRISLVISCLLTWFIVSGNTDLNAPTEVAPVLGTLIGRPLVALAAAGLLVATIGAPGVGARMLTSSWLTYLGRISYGLYVYQGAGILVAGYFVKKDSVSVHFVYVIGAFAMTVLFSSLSYRLLESPFLRLKERFTVVRSRPV